MGCQPECLIRLFRLFRLGAKAKREGRRKEDFSFSLRCEISEISEISPRLDPLNSLISLISHSGEF
jgi:hypothetical protein